MDCDNDIVYFRTVVKSRWVGLSVVVYHRNGKISHCNLCICIIITYTKSVRVYNKTVRISQSVKFISGNIGLY